MGIDILIPVLGRPEAAKALSESISVTVTPYRLLFLTSPNDRATKAAYEPFGEVVEVPWPSGKADFAKKINFGFENSKNEWIFQGATDIAFSERWDVEALQIAAKTGKRVIGTNDLHNPAVRRGKHSTHTLFARSYIEEHGGTEDSTGTVFCELYDHQYVDNEFIEVAKRRREFIFCREAVVEHFHPHWGNAQTDRTYKKGLRSSNADRMLYAERIGLQRNPPRRSNRPRA